MEAFSKFIEEKFAPPLIRFTSTKYVQILQKTFVSFTALLITGSFALLIAALPIKNWSEIIGPDTVALLGKITGVGTTFISVFVAIAASYYTISYYNSKGESMQPIPCMLLSVVSFILMTPLETGYNVDGDSIGSVLPLRFTGAAGIFCALLISIVTVEIYRYFIKNKITIKLPDSVPPMVVEAFAAIIPTVVVIVLWWVVRYMLNLDLPQIILNIFKPLIQAGDNIFAVNLIIFLNRALWSVGVHGGSVVGAVAGPVLTAMNVANQTAAEAMEVLPYIASGNFYDQYVWTGLAPVAIALMTSKSKKLRTIGSLGLIPALFNIGEPLMFGVPIVLNPLLMIPFIVGYMLNGIFAYLLCQFGILTTPSLVIPWTTPGPIKAFLASGSDWRALVWVLVSWAILFAVFYPFIKAMEKEDLKEEQE